MLLRTFARRFSPVLACLLLPSLLGACAITRTVDSTVQSYSSLDPVATPRTYQQVPLPSQKSDPELYAAVAALADAALTRAGLTRVDAAPQLLAQVTVRMESGYMQGPWYPYGPWGGGWPGGFGFGYGHTRGLRGAMLLRDLPPVLYRHEVQLLLRDAVSQEVVYETSAHNEDVWTQTPAVFGVLFDAALQGFPHPPTGPRQIRLPMLAGATTVPIPAAAPATADVR